MRTRGRLAQTSPRSETGRRRSRASASLHRGAEVLGKEKRSEERVRERSEGKNLGAVWCFPSLLSRICACFYEETECGQIENNNDARRGRATILSRGDGCTQRFRALHQRVGTLA